MATPITSSAVWPNYSTTNVNKAATKSNELGKDQFLGLFVAQLKNQDPLTPMDNADFIAQMAQFSSVEQLMNMTNELELLRQNIGTASSLIGKHVKWNEYDSNGSVVQSSGLVQSIVQQDGNLFVEVDGRLVGIDFISQISSQSANQSRTDSSSEQTVLAKNESSVPSQDGDEVSGS